MSQYRMYAKLAKYREDLVRHAARRYGVPSDSLAGEFATARLRKFLRSRQPALSETEREAVILGTKFDEVTKA